jgi:hypothetical protein
MAIDPESPVSVALEIVRPRHSTYRDAMETPVAPARGSDARPTDQSTRQRIPTVLFAHFSTSRAEILRND